MKFVLTPEGSLAGSFLDFLGKLAYYLVCCSHGAFKPSFNLLPTKYTLITRMPSDFIIPISAPNKRRSFSFVALCFNDLILFMEKKKKRKSLSYCSRARARTAADNCGVKRLVYKRGAGEGDSLLFLVCPFQGGSPNQ